MSKLLASHFVLKEISNRDSNGRDDTFGSTKSHQWRQSWKCDLNFLYRDINFHIWGFYIKVWPKQVNLERYVIITGSCHHICHWDNTTKAYVQCFHLITFLQSFSSILIREVLWKRELSHNWIKYYCYKVVNLDFGHVQLSCWKGLRICIQLNSLLLS